MTVSCSESDPLSLTLYRCSEISYITGRPKLHLPPPSSLPAIAHDQTLAAAAKAILLGAKKLAEKNESRVSTSYNHGAHDLEQLNLPSEQPGNSPRMISIEEEAVPERGFAVWDRQG